MSSSTEDSEEGGDENYAPTLDSVISRSDASIPATSSHSAKAIEYVHPNKG